MRARKLAAAAQSLKRQGNKDAPFSLAFLTDRRRLPHPEVIIRVLPKGAAVILRDYDMAGRHGLALRLNALCKAKGLVFLVGADPDLAAAVGADGVHAPSWFETRAEIGLLTASCHSSEELARAGRMGADLALLSPAFPTESHPDSEGLGATGFKALASGSPLPVLALGGVDETNAETLAGPNVTGLAAISAFQSR